MAWTTPHTFSDGVLVNAALLNTHIRDNLNYLKDVMSGLQYQDIDLRRTNDAATGANIIGRHRRTGVDSTAGDTALDVIGYVLHASDWRTAGLMRMWASDVGATHVQGAIDFITYNTSGVPNLNLRLSGEQAYAGDGVVSAPSWSFYNDPDTGLYRSLADAVALSAGGVMALEARKTGADVQVLIPLGSVSAPGLAFQGSMNSGIYTPFSNAMIFVAGANEAMRVAFSGSPMIGFYGSSGNTKQTVTGSRGANAALASLITALQSYGLVFDGSSA